MGKRQFRVRLTGEGLFEPLEPIDAEINEEGIVIFISKDEEVLIDDSKSVLSEQVLKRIWDNEEDDIYNNV
ncbi:MAG: hypothetical protein VKK32_03260 [Candidatus Melainabacteria bacterium]|jgi:hypothetical protein|nr:hypothetical protein [Candidatus Melainabacteria bacterium]